MVVDSDMIMENMDWDWLGVYLFLIHSDDELQIDNMCLPRKRIKEELNLA